MLNDLCAAETGLRRLDAVMSGIEWIQIQHIREDTEQFVALLEKHGFLIGPIFGPQYSADHNVVRRLRDRGFKVESLNVADIHAALRRAVAECSHPFVVCDVGGYAVSVAGGVPINRMLGIVEETTHGLRRYERASRFSVPVVETAASRLKYVENQFVGDAVCRRVCDLLTLRGSGCRGARVGIIGYGKIGASVARALVANRATVACLDRDPVRELQAACDGMLIHSREGLFRWADVIVGATGEGCLVASDLKCVRDEMLFVSASSKDIEFPLALLREASRDTAVADGESLVFRLASGQRVRLVNHGYPINFSGQSLPRPIADILFAAIVGGVRMLLERRPAPGLHSLEPSYEADIAAAWLSCHGSR